MERPLTRNFRPDGRAPDLDEYEKRGGYRAARKALGSMAPEEVTELVKASDLRGRGGAGFPAGLKWSFVPMGGDAPRPKYLVCNSDEMEPGTFKDRLLLSGDPHQLIEGLIIAAYAIQAEEGYVFLRHAYEQPAEPLTRAIGEAYAKGYLGGNVLGLGFAFDLRLHVSAGRYICGEETALLNALEGKRGIPRAKPPHPTDFGLWGKPTVANNVETICNVPHIVNNGADWFKGLSRSPRDGGTKLYGVSGRVKRPGWWELPMGTTAREILQEYAGGMREGYGFRGVIPGGASTEFLLEEHLDVKMDFDSLQEVGSRLGSGGMVVLDDRTCPVGMLHNLQMFFARESCGWCTPCREGLPWIEKTLQALEEGTGRSEDLDILEWHIHLIRPGNTFCVLAPGAMEPLQSGLKYFRDDFERHVRDKRCPFR